MKILFATMPVDGHFNPLTGLAIHLRGRGHDLRWYTGPSYAKRLGALGIEHAPFDRATDVNGENLREHFPEYDSLGSGPKAIAFALEKIFFGNLEAHYRDVCALYDRFPFEAVVFDAAFYAGRLIAEKLNVPTFSIYPAPTPAPKSHQAPPPFFGLKPASGLFGKLRERLVWAMVESSTQGGLRVLRELREREGFPPYTGSVFDLHLDTARAIFQIGTPGMDYPRAWPDNVHFVGPLMPHKRLGGELPLRISRKLPASLVVVSQGTVDNQDPEKLLVPTLEALKDGEHFVVACTGGRHTRALRERFPHENVLVEDWVDFDLLLPHAKLFVCNGGFGSVMQALVHGVPILAAGKLEGKNDINARLDYHRLALDLRTERPTPRRIAAGVVRVLGDPAYRASVERVRAELANYQPFEIIERHLMHAQGAARPDTSPAPATHPCSS